MEQLIFFALIIFLSIIESVARSRKQKGGGSLPVPPPDEEARTGQRPGTRPVPRPRPTSSEVPSYDADPSYDELGTNRSRQDAPATSSESMIPADLWEELSGLAREGAKPKPSSPPPPPTAPPPGKARRPPKRVPTASRPIPAPPTSRRGTPPATRDPAPAMTIEGVVGHAVHKSHAGFGTDPSSRAPSAQDNLDPLARVLGEDASSARRQLRGGARALRQALILNEVLGPPAAERPDRY